MTYYFIDFWDCGKWIGHMPTRIWECILSQNMFEVWRDSGVKTFKKKARNLLVEEQTADQDQEMMLIENHEKAVGLPIFPFIRLTCTEGD